MEEGTADSSAVSDNNIRLADCMCPICMSILLEPVTMPCSHELCRPCFRDTVEQVNFTCPLCRLRISNWARKQTKVNKLINWTRWKEIQAAFPEHVQKRLDGEDIDDVLQPVNAVRLCKPGEVRQEYELQVRQHEIERQEEEEIEKEKSHQVIKEIQEEELREYEQRIQEDERLRIIDEELARKLADNENPELNVGNLEAEQAKLDEHLARALQEEQQLLNISKQTQEDEEYARKLQDQLKKMSTSGSQNCSKYLTPRSKKASKVPTVNIETFFKKSEAGRMSETSDEIKDPVLTATNAEFAHDIEENCNDRINDQEIQTSEFTQDKAEVTSQEITCSKLKLSDSQGSPNTISPMFPGKKSSHSVSPMFFGPSTSKVIARSDVSLICVEDYNDDLGMEFEETSSSTLMQEPVDHTIESVVEDENEGLGLFDECAILESKDLSSSPIEVVSSPIESVVEEENEGLCLFDECAILESKDLSSSPIEVVSSPVVSHSVDIISQSPPIVIEDDDTRSNQEEITTKVLGAFSTVTKSPPTGIPRKNSLRSDSVGSTDSISHELSHFRPIVISPRTAARKLADGKPFSPSLVHTTPKNLKRAFQKGENEVLQKSPLLIAKWLSLAQEREAKIQVGSKSVMVGKSVIENNRKLAKPLQNEEDNNSESIQEQASDKSPTANSNTKVDGIDDTKVSNLETADTVKLSPGKVYRMKAMAPSQAKRKNLTKIWASMSEDVDQTTTTTKDTRINKNILNKILSQKEDKGRRIEEVKLIDTDSECNMLVNKECKNDGENVDATTASNNSYGKCNYVEDSVAKLSGEQPNKMHSEGKNIKKMNQTEEKGRRRNIGIKDCRTIEDMFAKFKQKLKHEDLEETVKHDSTNVTETYCDSEEIISQSSPAKDHQVLILNQTLSFSQKGESPKMKTRLKACKQSNECTNKRKHDGSLDGQRTLKFKPIPSFSSQRKTQPVKFSSPKKNRLKACKGKTVSRNDNEPLSPGSIKKSKFLKLQTKEEQRLQQEEMDRKIALKLQKEINREMKAEMNKINRSRGTDSEYKLRSRKSICKSVL